MEEVLLSVVLENEYVEGGIHFSSQDDVTQILKNAHVSSQWKDGWTVICTRNRKETKMYFEEFEVRGKWKNYKKQCLFITSFADDGLDGSNYSISTSLDKALDIQKDWDQYDWQMTEDWEPGFENRISTLTISHRRNYPFEEKSKIYAEMEIWGSQANEEPKKSLAHPSEPDEENSKTIIKSSVFESYEELRDCVLELLRSLQKGFTNEKQKRRQQCAY